MAKAEIKFPKKGAVSKLRQMNNSMRHQPVSPELVESLKKRPEKNLQRRLLHRSVSRNLIWDSEGAVGVKKGFCELASFLAAHSGARRGCLVDHFSAPESFCLSSRSLA
ncbi:hypothetical protein WDW86_16805 [Bdellovibrionota bacterium FG-2]